MKRIFNFAFLAATIFFGSAQLIAQRPDGQGRPERTGGPGGPGRGYQMTEEDIRSRVDNLAETLEMTDDQHQKILAAELDFYNRMQIERQKMRNAGGPPPDREAMRARMTEMREERDRKYGEILTGEQMEKYREIREQRREEMRSRNQEGNQTESGGERPARGRGRN